MGGYWVGQSGNGIGVKHWLDHVYSRSQIKLRKTKGPW